MTFAKNLCTMFFLKLNSQADRFFIVFRIRISNFGLVPPLIRYDLPVPCGKRYMYIPSEAFKALIDDCAALEACRCRGEAGYRC